MSDDKSTVVGFVGLGTMGAPMVANVAGAGFELIVYDGDASVTERIATQLGARPAGDVAELAPCDVVVLMLPTSAIVRSVLLSEDGQPRAAFRSGTVVVDMSSSDPTETVETGRLLGAAGLAMVDAPVSGARERASAGTLSIMLGADDESAAQRAIPVIDAMSQQIFRTGALGTGHAMKALNNFVAAAGFAAACEALSVGARFGLDQSVMLEILNASTGQNFSTTRVIEPGIIEAQFNSGFALPLLTKDVRIAAALEQAVAHETPVCAAVTGALGAALDALGNVDHTRAYEFWDGDQSPGA